MKEVRIQVPEGRCETEWWKSASPHVCASLLENIGCLLSSEKENILCNKRAEAAYCGAERPSTFEASSWARAFPSFPPLNAEEIDTLISSTLLCEVSAGERAGSRLVTTPDGLSMLVDVKDSPRLRAKEDVEQFRKDVYEGMRKQSVNAAVLLSLATSSFPNAGPGACALHIEQGSAARVPILYLATSSRTAIQLALLSFTKLHLMCKRESAALNGESVPLQLEKWEKDRALLSKSLPPLLSHMSEIDMRIESRMEMLQRLMDDALSERARHKDALHHALKITHGLDWVEHEDESSDVAMDIVLKFYERKGDFPKTSEMTLQQRAAIKTAGGLKKVVEEVKKKKGGE